MTTIKWSKEVQKDKDWKSDIEYSNLEIMGGFDKRYFYRLVGNKACLEWVYKRVKKFDSEICTHFLIRPLITYSPLFLHFSILNSYLSEDLFFLFYFIFTLNFVYLLEILLNFIVQYFCWEFYLSCHIFCFQRSVNFTYLKNIILLFNSWDLLFFSEIFSYFLFLPWSIFLQVASLPFSVFWFLFFMSKLSPYV